MLGEMALREAECGLHRRTAVFGTFLRHDDALDRPDRQEITESAVDADVSKTRSGNSVNYANRHACFCASGMAIIGGLGHPTQLFHPSPTMHR